MRWTRWTLPLLVVTLLGAPVGCADEDGDTTIIEEDAEPDVQVEEDDGTRVDFEVDEEGGVSGEVNVEENN